MKWLSTLALAASVSFVCGCKPDPKPGDAPPPPANLAPDAAVGVDSAVADRSTWKAAIANPDDALELARLAEAEGTSGLMVGLEEGGATGNIALLALPYADDSEHAMGRLSEILEQTPPESMLLVLDAMEGITLRPQTQAEPRDPMGVHKAFDALVRVANRKELPANVRARAVSVGRLLASRRPYDPKALPTDFDK